MPYLEVEQGNQEEIEEKQEVTVPNITNLSIQEAEKVLKEKGFEIKINNETEELDKKNIAVITQIPQAGITAYSGSCVYVEY